MYVRIWSFEHNAWWKPNAWGYTPDINEAGLYKRAEAEAIVNAANKYIGPNGSIQEEIRELSDE